MAGETIKYRRLPGAKRGFLHRASLWLGDDHLLAISGWPFMEDYRRYYYRDIQALVVTRARRFIVPRHWLLAMLAAGIMTAVSARIRPPAAWLEEGCESLLILLAMYLIVASLWQSCRCRIQTAVSREELPSLYRMWTARKALSILERRIGEVQGTLVEGWTASVPQSLAPAPDSAPQPGGLPAAAPAPGASQTAAPPRRNWVERALYASLALGGAALLLRPVGALWTAIMVVQVLLSIGMLVDRHLHGGSRSAGVVAILAMTLAGVVAYSDNLLSAFHHAQAHPRQFTMQVRPEDLGQTPVLNEIYAGGCILLAASGALAAALRRKE